MAMLAGTALFIMDHVLPALSNRESVLSIARMSMAWNVDDVVKNLDERLIPYSDEVADAMRARGNKYTTKEFFELLRFREYHDIDFSENEGCTIVHNLNNRLSTKHFNKYDLVIENGTLEHIFDIKTAIENIAGCVAEGGVVCHVSPLDAINHGFYNFSINLYNDFYGANGFGDFKIFGLRYGTDWRVDQNVIVNPLPYTHEELFFDPEIYKSPYNKLGIAFLARKEKHTEEFVVPTQAAYDPALGLTSRLSGQ